MHFASSPPITRKVDVLQALETLDYSEMVALSEMFARWAMFEEKLDDLHRSGLAESALDYAMVAGYCGPEWRATNPEDPPDAIAFMARDAMRSDRASCDRGSVRGGHHHPEQRRDPDTDQQAEKQE